MCILVSARLHATAAPEAPAPMIRTSTGSFIPVPSVIPGWSEGPDPESRDSGFDASHRPGMTTSSLVQDSDRQRTYPANKIRIEPRRRTHDLETKLALQDFLPENADLLLGEPVADAAVDAGAERKMLARLGAVDDELVGALDLVLVAVARDVPHHHLVALGDPAAAQFGIAARGAAHMQHRRLVADDFGDEARDQLAPRPHLLELFRVFHQRYQSASHGIAGGIVAADDQKPDGADELARVEIFGRFRMRQHRDEIEGRRRVAPGIPELAKILGHLDHLGGSLRLRMNDRIG